MYAFYFLLVTIICAVMMSPTVEEAMKENVSTFNPKSENVSIARKYNNTHTP